ncbi:hypothetical protein BDQ12DRAFT_736436 [Crucibulum laeve]|uniref:Uncharacterized protein n=1 Tax=Crucibulum laeve TaxID=68775 RepID=A0A5C3LWC1_9AGAR|nr:hypothetical protein BDQ12DRAFT_736436 [Crucibulum laeve]
MCSTSLRHPHQIFSGVSVPSPPPWPAPTSPSLSQTFTTSSSLQWKESKDQNKKRVARVLSHLQRNLRSVHKRKVAWPAEESISPNLSLSEYLMAILRPIVDLFNQLHSPNVLKTPMEYVQLDFGESILGATFTAEDFKIQCLTAPIVLCLPNSLFDSKGNISSHVEYALSKALEFKPLTPSIIVTNFKDITVFFAPACNPPEPVFERVSSTQSSLALRVISTACLNDALPAGHYINVPRPDMEVGGNLILPEGPPQDPKQPLLADEQVFATHYRHSDFDFVTLVRDRSRALQFFRWHEHVQQQCSNPVIFALSIHSTPRKFQQTQRHILRRYNANHLS